ncbi:hypothetical protein GGTG_04643 [Gaeumannomyces tritici R3-111a-1]|uniref:Uncharacterized protein n=1 Tax=Gaeumannomyces tritici (strain R3-111a-1) TaxID=644352 RepID=J3NTP3_GAET3|nr:hypothetical protein GGTG_04643 [Gaeumannomyces tritici R3-111a-1]EJT79558.1 hypothetical protein GGTG_04643 [Gaeumannomyces tritici R3-111a-1]
MAETFLINIEEVQPLPLFAVQGDAAAAPRASQRAAFSEEMSFSRVIRLVDGRTCSTTRTKVEKPSGNDEGNVLMGPQSKERPYLDYALRPPLRVTPVTGCRTTRSARRQLGQL